MRFFHQPYFMPYFFQLTFLSRRQRSKDKMLVHKSTLFKWENKQTKNSLTNNHANTDIYQKLSNWNNIYCICRNLWWIFIYWTNIITNRIGSIIQESLEDWVGKNESWWIMQSGWGLTFNFIFWSSGWFQEKIAQEEENKHIRH